MISHTRATAPDNKKAYRAGKPFSVSFRLWYGLRQDDWPLQAEVAAHQYQIAHID